MTPQNAKHYSKKNKQYFKELTYITKPIRVRYSDTDQMGYMHHSNYLRFFEIARLEWLQVLGISYQKMEKEGVWLPVVSADTHYKSPAFFEDELVVHVSLDKPPTAALFFSYTIYNQNQVLVCSGTTKLAFLDAARQRPMRCPKALFEVLHPLC